jgi:translation initiation factor IF-2
MSDVTVAQFAEVLKVPVDRLLLQLESAGIQVAGPQALISDEAKLELLTHLRRAHGASEPTSKTATGVAAPRKITLARKSQSELKQASTQGRARTVNVEVRHKKTYIKRDVLEEQNKQHQDEADLKKKELEAAEAAERERAEAARRESERMEAENRRRIEDEAAKKKQAEEARRQQEES